MGNAKPNCIVYGRLCGKDVIIRTTNVIKITAEGVLRFVMNGTILVIFFKWANEHGYHEGLSIDRIDNDKGYSPQNCRWATMLTQNNNTRHCRRITYHGETHTVAEWERKLNMKCGILEQRLLRGMTLSDALSTPVKTCQTRYVTYKGKVMSLHGWAKHLGMNYSTFQSKINKGISMEDIIKEHNGR